MLPPAAAAAADDPLAADGGSAAAAAAVPPAWGSEIRGTESSHRTVAVGTFGWSLLARVGNSDTSVRKRKMCLSVIKYLIGLVYANKIFF